MWLIRLIFCLITEYRILVIQFEMNELPPPPLPFPPSNEQKASITNDFNISNKLVKASFVFYKKIVLVATN